MVVPGDDLAQQIYDTLVSNKITLQDGDMVCIAQKIVSKAEGQQVALADVEPSEQAIALAAQTDKDPRMVELILQESTEVLRQRLGVLIVRHNLGMVGAHAGIDQSNIDHSGGEQALLLPKDPDKSAACIRDKLQSLAACELGVIITDSHNRPWRMGTIGVAIGCAGIQVLDDHRGGEDIYGRELKVTLINRADALAAAATLEMGETTEKIPLVLIRGLPASNPTRTAAQNAAQTAAMINRPLEEDLFR